MCQSNLNQLCHKVKNFASPNKYTHQKYTTIMTELIFYLLVIMIVCKQFTGLRSPGIVNVLRI